MKNSSIILVLFISFCSFISFSQNFTDTVYAINTEFDIDFDTVVGFAGESTILEMDISYPTNDSPPACGRPLLVVVHGGAWIAGDKSEGNVSRIRADFAKRGYTTASVNYRLGQFHSSTALNCNLQLFGLEWNCLNMGDSTEWYRAYYRGIQDVNSSIRFLVNNAAQYGIDPSQIFVVGESAGGFIAMGVGYIDDVTEVSQSQIGAMPDIAAPNSAYEATCIQSYGLASSISTMNLARPALGSYDDGGNYPLQSSYAILGVGNIFGGVFDNIFDTYQTSPPSLFLFHQPNDLIVPFNSGKVFMGYNNCLLVPPFNCGNIINRPNLFGSNGIKMMIDDLASQGQIVPDYLTNFSSNSSPCSVQPSQGHAYDNFWLRTSNMASFFASKMSICDLGFESNKEDVLFSIYPNPAGNDISYINGPFEGKEVIEIRDIKGKLMMKFTNSDSFEIPFSTIKLPAGIYIISIVQNEQVYYNRFVKM